MKVLKIALALAIAAISSFTAHAKNDPTTAYMFGFASSFSDSTVYMTSVQRVDSVYLTHKKLFLDNRENYSLPAEGIPGVRSVHPREPAS